MTRLVAVIAVALLLRSFSFTPLSAFAAQSSAVQTSDRYAEKLRVFEEFVRRQMERDKIPGLTIGFTKDDYTWVKGFGFADLENKTPAKAESAYRLASVTKPMTAVAVLQLVEKGKINLDAEVQTYVPDYPKQKWPVTIRQLLGHLGGGQSCSGLGPERKTVREVVALIAQCPLEAEPGTKFIYTTSGYNLLGAAIESASGQSFEDYLREHIWRPLEMHDTRMDDVRELTPNRVRGYELVNNQIKNAPFVDVSTRFGGGGATSTIPDLLRLARGLNSERVLSKASIDLMYTPLANRDGRFTGFTTDGWDYALGWFVFPINGRFAVHHEGGQKGTSTLLMRAPTENFAIAFACNREGASFWIYARRLFELMFDEKETIPVFTKHKADEALYTAMKSVFDYGVLRFDMDRRPLTENPQELAQAFAYFNDIANREAAKLSPQEVENRIKDGRHPVARQSFVKLGSYMAAKLREKHGADRFKEYHRMGAISFFSDYVEMVRVEAAHNRELGFGSSFERKLATWRTDWTRTWNEDARNLTITPEVNLEVIGESLRKSFAGAEVYPNFAGNLLNSVWAFHYWQGAPEKALAAARLAAELYPQSEFTNFVLSISLLGVAKDINGARAALKQSLDANPNGIAGPGRLNTNAQQIAGGGKTDVAVELLKLGLELHPKEALLYDSLGDLYLQKNQKDEALQHYKRALEVDPNFTHAKEMLKKLM